MEILYEISIKNDKGELLATKQCDQEICTIGRGSRNAITLNGWRIAGVHAELSWKNGKIYVTDLSGGHGTWINGEKITTFGPLGPKDVFSIGPYRLSITNDHNRADQQKPDNRTNTLGQAVQQDEEQTEKEYTVKKVEKSNLRAHLSAGEESDKKFIWHNRIHEKLMKAMDLRRVDIEKLDEKQLAAKVEGLITEIIANMDHDLPPEVDRERLAIEVLHEAVGLGPLEELLADENITEIMVNRYNDIYFEAAGKLHKSNITFSSDDAVRAVIDRIVSPLGRRIDESSPMVDGRLKDGSRVNAIIPPLAIKGPCLTIRKFAKKILNSEDMVQLGSISEDMMRFLEIAIHNRKNIVVSGGTGSGKTTFLNVLSNFIPHSERIITIEDAAELQLAQPHTISLEARPPNLEGKGMVTIRDLVKNSLRMRPDRIIVGECRGGESLDMLQAMNTGHDGSLTTVHANSPRDLISRIEVMVMMAGMEFPERAIREQIASAINLVVQQARFSDGSRKVTYITEITGMESGTIQMQNIFQFEQKGLAEDGTVLGEYVATGRIPEFYEDLRQRGLDVDMSIFN